MKDFWHIVVISLGLIALYLLLSSKNTEPILATGFTGTSGVFRTLQGR